MPSETLYAALLGGLLAAAPRRWMRVAGLTLIGAAAAPLAAGWLLGRGEERRHLALHSELDFDKPIGEVFDFFKDFENYQHVSAAIESVVDDRKGLSHWSIRAPSGGTLDWDAVVTKYVPRSVIAWESLPNDQVESTGLVRFSPLPGDRTRVDLRLTYRPLHTEWSDAWRALIARRPDRRLRDVLQQTRAYVETLPSPSGG